MSIQQVIQMIVNNLNVNFLMTYTRVFLSFFPPPKGKQPKILKFYYPSMILHIRRAFEGV